MNLLERVIALLARVNAVILAGCRYTTVLLVALITVVVVAQVFWRYVLNDALAWSEETAKFLMVWMVFAGAPIALSAGGLASVDALPNALPRRAQQALYGVIFLSVLSFLLVLIWQGYWFARNAEVQVTPTTGVSMMYVFMAMPAGGVMMAMIALELFLKAVLGIFRPERGLRTAGADQAAVSPE